MGGTPEFLMNTRRGLYSYEALQRRLAENTFARDGLVDRSGPVIKLESLAPEELFVLLVNVRRVMQGEDADLPDKALEAFMQHCSEQIGDAYFQKPSDTVTAFVNFLSTLEQNTGAQWTDLIKDVSINVNHGDDMSDIDESTGAQNDNDDMVSFKL